MGFFDDFAGVVDAHVEDENADTGVSVFIFPEGAVASAEVRGFAAGTRQFDSLDPFHSVERIHGVVFSGGSVFGHSAAQGAVEVLAARGIGLPTEYGPVPVVPSAVIYDLGFGGGVSIDYLGLGRRAAELALSGDGGKGTGAGAGASVGKLLGLARATKTCSGAAWTDTEWGRVGAFVVLNSFGEITDGKGEIIAGIRGDGGFVSTGKLLSEGVTRKPFSRGGNTTLGLLLLEAEMSGVDLHRLCAHANNFLATLIRPYGTVYDGDVVVSVSTGALEAPPSFGMAAATVESLLEKAVFYAVRNATGARGVPSAREFLEKEEG